MPFRRHAAKRASAWAFESFLCIIYNNKLIHQLVSSFLSNHHHHHQQQQQQHNVHVGSIAFALKQLFVCLLTVSLSGSENVRLPVQLVAPVAIRKGQR